MNSSVGRGLPDDRAGGSKRGKNKFRVGNSSPKRLVYKLWEPKLDLLGFRLGF